MFTAAYRAFGYLGLMTVFGTLLYGFRHDAGAPSVNYLFNVALYGAFALPHLLFTRGWFKRALWGDPAGSPRERRLYIAVAVITWVIVFALHWPVPGPAVAMDPAVAAVLRFLGMTGFLLCVVLFFEGTTREALDRLLGVPGSELSFSHGTETPLFTEGPYAEVRHPMYRAAILAGLCSLLIHPHVGQLFWALLIGSTFIAFIPIEEAQLVAARGDDYRRYQQQTPWRLFRGIW